MDFKQLECFIAISETLNFSRAAEKLYMTQPTLSRRISDLEEELGVFLFTRNTKKVKLTEAGMYFVGAASNLLLANKDVLRTARSLSTGMRGKLDIGFQGSAREVLPEMLRGFHEAYPDIQISLEQQGAKYLYQDVIAGVFDIAVAFIVAREKSMSYPQLASKGISSDTMGVFISEKKAEKYLCREKLTLDDLSSEIFLQIDRNINPGYFEVLHYIYLGQNFYPKKILEVRTVPAMMVLLDAGMGVALLPERSTNLDGAKIATLPVDGVSEALPIEAVWRKDNTNPCLSLFIDSIA